MLAITKDLQVIKVGKGRPIAGRRLLALVIEPTDSQQVSSMLTSHLLVSDETLKGLPAILQDVSHKYSLPNKRWSEEPQLPLGEMYTFNIKTFNEQTISEDIKRAFESNKLTNQNIFRNNTGWKRKLKIKINKLLDKILHIA